MNKGLKVSKIVQWTMRKVFPSEGPARGKAELLKKQAHCELRSSCLINIECEGISSGRGDRGGGQARLQRARHAIL